MVKQNVDFVVYDAKTNEDITRSVLTQIIFEEESQQGQNLLPIQFLRQLIGFYGNSMQAFLPSYLELSLASFTQQQERMRDPVHRRSATRRARTRVRRAGAPEPRPLRPGDEDVLAVRLCEARRRPPPAPKAEPRRRRAAAASPASDEALVALRKQMEDMQAQIEKLAGKR